MLHNKVVLCGDAGVGKTALVSTIKQSQFIENYEPTEISSYCSFEVQNDNEKTTKVNLWDICGDKNIKDELEFYFINVDVVALMFDTSNADSFASLNFWLDLYNGVGNTLPASLVVIGNKTDIENRAISREEAESWSKSHNANYLEISVKTRDGINELKMNLSDLCLHEKGAPKTSSDDVSCCYL